MGRHCPTAGEIFTVHYYMGSDSMLGSTGARGGGAGTALIFHVSQAGVAPGGSLMLPRLLQVLT